MKLEFMNVARLTCGVYAVRSVFGTNIQMRSLYAADAKSRMSGNEVVKLIQQNRFNEALGMYNKFPNPIGAASLIAKQTKIDEAFKIYETLLKNSQPDIFVITSLISSCRRLKQPQRAQQLWSQLEGLSIQPNDALMRVMAVICAESKDPKMAKEIFHKAEALNIKVHIRNHAAKISIGRSKLL
jgi:hypothetical protein